jgi:hypothetical protein
LNLSILARKEKRKGRTALRAVITTGSTRPSKVEEGYRHRERGVEGGVEWRGERGVEGREEGERRVEGETRERKEWRKREEWSGE